MSRTLQTLPEVPEEWPAREVERADTEALAVLMHEAYRGTPDDEGETLEDARAEVEKTLDGEYGTFLRFASFACEGDGRLLGASLVTHWRGAPLIAFAMTHPEVARRGLATSLILRSLHALAGAGYREANLAVTDANDPARRLYEKLGFARHGLF
jgi:ribosomal protein S18 acetylase RimI-like enzyme